MTRNHERKIRNEGCLDYNEFKRINETRRLNQIDGCWFTFLARVKSQKAKATDLAYQAMTAWLKV